MQKQEEERTNEERTMSVASLVCLVNISPFRIETQLAIANLRPA